jgi:molecular chaperone DnaK (HSP70)
MSSVIPHIFPFPGWNKLTEFLFANFSVDGRRKMTSTPTEPSTVLGIAFGNSTTQIAFISRAGIPECLANEDGERQIPSTLSYSEGEEYHGGQAKTQLIRNSANTIISFRDWLGQK